MGFKSALFYLSLAKLASHATVPVFALENGVGRLPFMGFNTWNAWHCDINETVILESARLLKSLGLADLGYNYVNIDDCYSEKKRNAEGDIIAHKERFPSGMKNFTDQVHALGLKAGIYGDSGWFTCQLYPGSFQNEERDARLFSDWGFDLLKYDNCAVPFDHLLKENIYGKYTRMARALENVSKSTGRPPMLFSLCEWGRQEPWLWARRLGHTWRTTDDIGPWWDIVTSILNENAFYASATDFYGHNDLDMLEVGNGFMWFDEWKTHFTAWALMKSPLVIGTDLSKASEAAIGILKNHELIAINQDNVVGTGITPFRWGVNPDWTFDRLHPPAYWSGDSENGTVIMLLNTLEKAQNMTFNMTESPWIRAGRQYLVRDLWTHTDNYTTVRNITVYDVPPHGVVALLLKDAGDEPEGLYPPCVSWEWCMDQNGTRIDDPDYGKPTSRRDNGDLDDSEIIPEALFTQMRKRRRGYVG